MQTLISIEENLLHPSSLPINFGLVNQENSETIKPKKQKKVRSRAKTKSTHIERPETEKEGIFKKRKIKEEQFRASDFETIDEGGATEILGDVFIDYLILECESPKGTMQIEISREEFVIGKDPSADAIIDFNPAISRRHCKITYRDERYFIEDLGSSNGTYVNRKRIDETIIPLKNGDRLILANTKFIVKER